MNKTERLVAAVGSLLALSKVEDSVETEIGTSNISHYYVQTHKDEMWKELRDAFKACSDLPKLPSSLAVQEGGSHYKGRSIQPVEYIQANNLNFNEGSVIKYTTRHRSKAGAEDLKKALHYLRFLLEFDYMIRSRIEYEDTSSQSDEFIPG